MRSDAWRWGLGLTYIFSVAVIWIAASFVVQSVVDAGVSPFLITYICNSLFVIYIPLVEIGRHLEDKYGSLLFWRSREDSTCLHHLQDSEEANLLCNGDGVIQAESLRPSVVEEQADETSDDRIKLAQKFMADRPDIFEPVNHGLDAKGRWTRRRVAKVSLLICPFWFLAQLSFNLSLKYTTVTVSSDFPPYLVI